MKEFCRFCYWKLYAMTSLLLASKFLVITDVDNFMYAVRNNLTIGECKQISEYLNKLAEDSINEIETDKALDQVKKIIDSK